MKNKFIHNKRGRGVFFKMNGFLGVQAGITKHDKREGLQKVKNIVT